MRKYESLCCHFGVWDEGVKKLDNKERYETIVKKNRKNFCFFWEYRHGMLFQAAETLQKREEDRWVRRKERIIAIIGLWIAAIGLLANVIIKIIR